MKTLVYFASGCYRPEYQNLDFDRIILIDNCFKRRYPRSIFKQGKITCIGMDALASIEYLKKENIKIDYFVSLNEGLYEGGGRYAINSDFFLGYAMPLLKDNYIHIMNKNYYLSTYKVSMDLPYKLKEIPDNDNRYLSPFIFSKDNYHKKDAKVYQMVKISNICDVKLKSNLKLKIFHDSIWNHYKDLDYVVVSFSQQGQGDYFDNLEKVINLKNTSIDEILGFCSDKKVKKIGFIPWARGKYKEFIKKIDSYQADYPEEISLFHLNKWDYKEIKEYAGNSGS